MHRWPPGELGWDLDQRFGDKNGYGVEVARSRLEAEPLGFQRNRSPAAERVHDRRGVAVAGTSNLSARFHEYGLVSGLLPFDQCLDNPEESLAFRLLGFFARELARVGRGVVDQRSEDDRTTCG